MLSYLNEDIFLKEWHEICPVLKAKKYCWAEGLPKPLVRLIKVSLRLILSPEFFLYSFSQCYLSELNNKCPLFVFLGV